MSTITLLAHRGSQITVRVHFQCRANARNYQLDLDLTVEVKISIQPQGCRDTWSWISLEPSRLELVSV